MPMGLVDVDLYPPFVWRNSESNWLELLIQVFVVILVFNFILLGLILLLFIVLWLSLEIIELLWPLLLL